MMFITLRHGYDMHIHIHIAAMFHSEYREQY